MRKGSIGRTIQVANLVGRESGGSTGSSVSAVSGSSGPAAPGTGTGNVGSVDAVTSSNPSHFDPDAVTDKGIDRAKADITEMSAYALRDLVTLFETCTARGHPTVRTGNCGAVNRRYRSNYAKDRSIDRTLAEFDRTVQFQSMFQRNGPVDTRYEDSINTRLRDAAKSSLTVRVIQPEISSSVTRDVSTPK